MDGVPQLDQLGAQIQKVGLDTTRRWIKGVMGHTDIHVGFSHSQMRGTSRPYDVLCPGTGPGAGRALRRRDAGRAGSGQPNARRHHDQRAYTAQPDDGSSWRSTQTRRTLELRPSEWVQRSRTTGVGTELSLRSDVSSHREPANRASLRGAIRRVRWSQEGESSRNAAQAVLKPHHRLCCTRDRARRQLRYLLRKTLRRATDLPFTGHRGTAGRPSSSIVRRRPPCGCPLPPGRHPPA